MTDISQSQDSSHAYPPKVGIVSLGCPKAVVDLELILNRMRAQGYITVKSYQEADVVLVNSCGFIDSAREETLEAIGEALHENGKVIVTGCMGADEKAIRDRHPKVLAITGPHNTEAAMQALNTHLPPREAHRFTELMPERDLRLTPPHYAYLKLSEGCNNQCSFCIIPQFRGRLVSRPAAKLLYEAERLVASGVKEILVISQDSGAYGVDLHYETSPYRGNQIRAHITDLAKALGSLPAWIRLHYIYPYPHIDELVPLMAEGLILPYLDVPFQHASPLVLKAMKRPADQLKLLRRLERWRKICPDIAIRSTFIVGFPGEGEAEFAELLTFLKEANLDHVGAFAFENVEGARANELPNQVPLELRQQRLKEFMALAESLSFAKNQQKIGTKVAVMIDSPADDGYYWGHSASQSPEIDGKVRLKPLAGKVLMAGEVVAARIETVDAFDLYARQIRG